MAPRWRRCDNPCFPGVTAMLRRACILAALLVVITPARGGAVTLEDLIALSAQGLGDEGLVAVIDADRTVFHPSPEQVMQVKKAGLHDAVIVKMLGTAREFADDAAAPPPVVVIGERPSAPVVAEAVTNPFFVVVPFPVAVAGAPRPPHARAPEAAVPRPAEPRTFGRFINDGWVEGLGFGRFINDGTIPPAGAARPR